MAHRKIFRSTHHVMMEGVHCFPEEPGVVEHYVYDQRGIPCFLGSRSECKEYIARAESGIVCECNPHPAPYSPNCPLHGFVA